MAINGPVEIVDLPIKSMVDLSVVLWTFTGPGNSMMIISLVFFFTGHPIINSRNQCVWAHDFWVPLDRKFWDPWPFFGKVDGLPEEVRWMSFSNPHLIQLFPPISADSRNPPWSKKNEFEAVGPSSRAFEAVQWTLRSLLVAPPARSLED